MAEDERMARDRRVEYTKMVIRDSLIRLLKEKPIHKITVKEVCELADINRSTFYKYYLSPYDWFEQAVKECQEITKEVLDRIDSTDTEVLLTELLEKIKANCELFRVIYIHREDLFKELLALHLEKAEVRFKDVILKNPVGNQKWDYYFLIYGCNGIVSCWIKDGMEQSPNELASYITNLIQHAL